MSQTSLGIGLAQMHPPDDLPAAADPISTRSRDDAIIRVAAYHRRDFNLATLHRTTPLNSSELSLFRSFNRNSGSTLGDLDILPPEILTAITLLLDLQSALQFSHTNTRAKDLIAGIHEYRQTRDHALQCLWAAFTTRVASTLCISAIHTALVTRECSRCGAFGRFFSLLTATQCCFHCLERSPEFATISVTEVCRATYRTRAWLESMMPVLYTVPGIYGLAGTDCKRRRFIAAKAHCATRLDLQATLRIRFNTSQGIPEGRYMASCGIPYLDTATGIVEMGLSCKGCQVMLEEALFTNKRRFTAPYIRRDAVYSREGFLKHFWRCEGAKELWDLSKGGTVPFEEPMFTKQGGFIAKRAFET